MATESNHNSGGQGITRNEEAIDRKLDAEYFNRTLPPGYRFLPADDELIDYLKKKLSGKSMDTNQIMEVDLYAQDPQELTEKFKLYREEEWYFFTSRERKYPKGWRPRRATDTGYWKPTGNETYVKRNGQRIGVKTALDFYRGNRMGAEKTEWKMHEYTLHKSSERRNDQTDKITGTQLDKWVLCKVYKNSRGRSTAGQQAQVEEGNPSEDVNGDSQIPNHRQVENDPHVKEELQIERIPDQIEARLNPTMQSNNDIVLANEPDRVEYTESALMAFVDQPTPNLDMAMIADPMYSTTNTPMWPQNYNSDFDLQFQFGAGFHASAPNFDNAMGFLSPTDQQTSSIMVQQNLVTDFDLYQSGLGFYQPPQNYDVMVLRQMDQATYWRNQPSSSSIPFPDNRFASSDFFGTSDPGFGYDYEGQNSNADNPPK